MSLTYYNFVEQNDHELVGVIQDRVVYLMMYPDPQKIQVIAIAFGCPLEPDRHPNAPAVFNTQIIIGSTGWTGTLWH